MWRKYLVVSIKANRLQSCKCSEGGRSADDIRQISLSLLPMIMNHLSSLCRNIAGNLEKRLENVKDHKSTDIIKTMGKCLNVRYS